MLKSFISFLLLVFVVTAHSQQVNVATANLERLKYKTGVMILYYGPNRMVKYCSLWDVKFKKEDNEERIGNLLKDKVAAYDPYMYFEFKEGFDCNNATGYLQKKGVSKMSISSCNYIDFSENPNGSGNMNGTAAWNNPDRVTPDYVDQLPTYSWALVNRVVKNKMEQLEKDGWQRVYVEYNLAGGSKNLWVGKALSFSPDSMYKAIATVINSNYYLKLLNFDKPLVDGFPYQEYFKEYKGDSLGETIAFKPTERITKIIAAAVSADEVNTNNAGIMVYRKKYNLQDEFQSVLDDAKSNFANYKLDETKDPNGVTVFNATRVFGLKKQMIFQAKQSKEWMFSQFCNTDDAYAPTIKKSITDIIDSYVKTGNYLTESGEHEGDMVYRLMDKKENILFQMAVGLKKISLNFFATQAEPTNTIANNNITADVKKEESNSKKNTSAPQVPFINPAKTYVFQNWNWAKITFKWNWLETPANDPNVSREFLDFSDNSGNTKDDIILRIKQKTGGYMWATATPNVGKFAAYTYSAILGLVDGGGSEFGQGLMILYKESKKGDFSHLYFLIDPVKQTYWFGSHNSNNNKWETHNHYSGNTYNIFSTAINKHINDGTTITKNIISIEKQSDKFLLYINNQLVETVVINKNNEALNNFEGIGIVTVDKQVSTVDKLTFSR